VAPEIGEPVRASSPGGAPAIECRSLEVRYGEKLAVAGLSFTVAAGEVVAILGPNGAGKTSTVENLEGYRRPSSGSVRVLGLDPRRDHRAVVSRIGVMLQKGGIYPTMTAGEAVRLFARYYENPVDPEELLETLDLRRVDRTPWRRLSGGEQQRVSFALALVGRPAVAFLDEPTAGVDPEGRVTIREVIAGLKEGGASVLLTTHELSEAERVADRVIILARGKCLAEGTLDQLAEIAGAQGIHFEAPAGLDRGSLASALDITTDRITETRPGSYEVQVVASPSTIASLTAWLAGVDVAVRNLRTGGPVLEDVYMSLVGSVPSPEPAPVEQQQSTSGRRRRRKEEPC
jgi:ABC-2 type transport system ATP-binding protein